jgi:hypothetical protein
MRGEAYLAEHRGAEAAAEFKKVLDHPGIVVADPIGAMAHLQLGRALAVSGDKAKANIAYQDFLALWENVSYLSAPYFPADKTRHAEQSCSLGSRLNRAGLLTT